MSYLNFSWLFGNRGVPEHRLSASQEIPRPRTGAFDAGDSLVAFRSSGFDRQLQAAVSGDAERCGETKTQMILVAGADCEVTAHKTGKASWKAYGYVQGMPIHATGETAPAAFRQWRSVAKTMLRN
jgi:hypothetical protein